MDLPFTRKEFFEVFRDYNESIWPMQIVAVAVCFALILLMARGASARWVFVGLAALWAWNGVAYHYSHFSAINPAARAFGVLFLFQAALFFWASVRNSGSFRLSPQKWQGAAVLLYGVVAYAVLGYALDHVYPATPVLGVAPCPTVIFTFGTLMQSEGRLKWWLIVIPILWAVVGTSAAFLLGVREDLGLGASALLFLIWQYWPRTLVQGASR